MHPPADTCLAFSPPICPICHRPAYRLLLTGHFAERHLRCEECSARRLAFQRFADLAAGIRFRDWTITVLERGLDLFLRASFTAPCNVTGTATMQHSRKWLLSVHMTDGEVIQTAFKCILTAMEHEIREEFTWQGQPIFGPHFSISALHHLCSINATEVRPLST